MTPEELRDRISELRELLDAHENFNGLRSQMLSVLAHSPNSMAIIEAEYGTCGHDTFTIPLSELVPLLTRRIEHFERKIGELK